MDRKGEGPSLVPGRGFGWSWEVAQAPRSGEGHLDQVVTLMGNQVFGKHGAEINVKLLAMAWETAHVFKQA